MAQRVVSMQYLGVVHTRPNTTETGPPFTSADDTGVVAKIGSYNRPPNPGESIFTSIRSIVSACITLNTTYQRQLGQNTRFTIYGKPCGTALGTAARQLLPAELAEKIYVEGDTEAAGLYDAVRFANRVPNTGTLLVRSILGPEAEMSVDNTASPV